MPTVRALAEAGRPFRGLLYGGLMLTPDRGPMVIEWNCRFGDPETQSVLMRFDGDLLPWLAGVAERRAAGGRAARAPGRRASAWCWRPAATRASRAPATRSPACRPSRPTTWWCSTPAPAATPRGPTGHRGRPRAGRDRVRRRPERRARARLRGDRRHPFRWYAFPPRHRHAREHTNMSDATNKLDVAIMMGSKSDLETMQPAAKVLEKLGLAVEVRVLSAHRTPEETAAFVQGAGRRRRQGVHLRRGRRRPPGGRRRRAHHAPGHRHADRLRAAWAVSTRCCRRCRCRRACRSRRSRSAAPRTPACWPRRSSPSPIRSWASASRPSAPRAARRSWTATPRSARKSAAVDGGRAAATANGTRLRRGDRLRRRGAAPGRDRRLPDGDLLRPRRRRARRAGAGAAARAEGARRQGDLGPGRRAGDAGQRLQRRAAARGGADGSATGRAR